MKTEDYIKKGSEYLLFNPFSASTGEQRSAAGCMALKEPSADSPFIFLSFLFTEPKS